MALEAILSVKTVTQLGEYLGFSIIHGDVKADHFAFLIHTIHKKLNEWTTKCLSMVAKITLTKYVLASIANYCMHVILLPRRIINENERLMRRFISGGSKTHSVMSSVDWEEICQPFTFGGLGLRNLNANNEAFFMKLGFNMLAHEDELWMRLLKEKYKVGNDCPPTVRTTRASGIWIPISKVWHRIYDGIGWSLGDGSRSEFWTDIWCPKLGPLISHKCDDAIVDVDDLTNDMTNENGEWEWSLFKDLIYEEILPDIEGDQASL